MGDVIPFPDRTANEPWMRQHQAAAHLGVSLATLRRWRLRGLPHERVGGVVLYKPSAIEAWVRRQSLQG